MPGVTSIGEGSSGVNVRGGASDQNLFIFDNAPIFNTTHLFGFYSSINNDLINEVNLYKGYVPSSYGGRASSVIKVDSRDGNEQEVKFRGGVGMIGSRLTVDLPVIKNKSSLVLGGRVSYSDWLTKQVNDITVQESSAQFYDANAKWHYNISESDKVELSGYFSSDKFRFGADTLYQWTTANGSFKWLHSFNSVLSSSFDLVTANYNSKVNGL